MNQGPCVRTKHHTRTTLRQKYLPTQVGTYLGVGTYRYLGTQVTFLMIPVARTYERLQVTSNQQPHESLASITSSLSFRSVEALLHWCDHFFRIAVANANRRGMTMVYDPDQDRARFGEHATSRKAARAQPSCRRRAGDTNSISRRACSMTYHQKMSFKHGRGGFHRTTTLHTSRHHQASFFSNNQTIRAGHLLAPLLKNPIQPIKNIPPHLSSTGDDKAFFIYNIPPIYSLPFFACLFFARSDVRCPRGGRRHRPSKLGGEVRHRQDFRPLCRVARSSRMITVPRCPS